jgi:hypothetical protein
VQFGCGNFATLPGKCGNFAICPLLIMDDGDVLKLGTYYGAERTGKYNA